MTRTKLFVSALTALLLPALVGLSSVAVAKRRSRKAQITGKVNLNTAPVKLLVLLPRVGKATAKRIVDYRAKQRFSAIRDIMRVKGIGKATFLKAKPHLTVHGPNTLRKLKVKRAKRKAGRRKRGPRGRRYRYSGRKRRRCRS